MAIRSMDSFFVVGGSKSINYLLLLYKPFFETQKQFRKMDKYQATLITR